MTKINQGFNGCVCCLTAFFVLRWGYWRRVSLRDASTDLCRACAVASTMLRGVAGLLCIFSLLLGLAHASELSVPQCSDFVDNVDGPYWYGTRTSLPLVPSICWLIFKLSLVFFRDEVANCTACVNSPGCGYCLSTLRCEVGDFSGPTQGFCPGWINEAPACPGQFSNLSKIFQKICVHACVKPIRFFLYGTSRSTFTCFLCVI